MAKKSDNGLIKAISIIDYIFGALFFLGALFMLLGGTILASIGGTAFLKNVLPSGIAGGLIGGVLIMLAIFLAALGILYIYLGKGIAAQKKWAKIVQIIVAILVHLFSFPIGTAVAIFELYVLLIKKETKNLFK